MNTTQESAANETVWKELQLGTEEKASEIAHLETPMISTQESDSVSLKSTDAMQEVLPKQQEDQEAKNPLTSIREVPEKLQPLYAISRQILESGDFWEMIQFMFPSISWSIEEHIALTGIYTLLSGDHTVLATVASLVEAGCSLTSIGAHAWVHVVPGAQAANFHKSAASTVRVTQLVMAASLMRASQSKKPKPTNFTAAARSVVASASEKFVCVNCMAEFQSAASYEAHGGNCKPYFCCNEGCGEKFPDEHQMLLHMERKCSKWGPQEQQPHEASSHYQIQCYPQRTAGSDMMELSDYCPQQHRPQMSDAEIRLVQMGLRDIGSNEMPTQMRQGGEFRGERKMHQSGGSEQDYRASHKRMPQIPGFESMDFGVQQPMRMTQGMFGDFGMARRQEQEMQKLAEQKQKERQEAEQREKAAKAEKQKKEYDLKFARMQEDSYAQSADMSHWDVCDDDYE
eukprot:TRINITY_DN12060_c0_g1_i1.p1 TRINITY_DN12060_c0_g1~~TRINITY_DN12060_c0_g1_i1.p1  ORF type:complete len:457 (-),score=112.33 TRINITY_DN12060_c0_g1_i1:10-1380(-)